MESRKESSNVTRERMAGRYLELRDRSWEVWEKGDKEAPMVFCYVICPTSCTTFTHVCYNQLLYQTVKKELIQTRTSTLI